MFRLVKYLKPFTVLILISLVLLFLQALANLALPDYMSNIVNVGIQQEGVENAVPEAVRKSQMDKLVIFMDEESRSEVLESYTLKARTSSDYIELSKKYPRIRNEGIYVLSKISAEKTDRINKYMGRAFLAVTGIEQITTDPQKAAAAAGMLGLDVTRIPEGTTAEQAFAMIKTLPEAQLSALFKTMNARFDELGDKMVTQSAIGAVKGEYAAIGIDTGKVQSTYIWFTGLLMLLLSLASAVCTIGVGYLSAKTAAGLAKNLREMAFERVESFSNTEFDKFSTASLITRSTNDITQIQMLIIVFMRMVFYAPILVMGGIILVLKKSKSTSCII